MNSTAGGGRYYALLLATVCPDKAPEVGQATGLWLVGRSLQKLEGDEVAVLVEKVQSHHQDMQKAPLSNHGPPPRRERRAGLEDGRVRKGEREQDMGRGTHAAPAKVQSLRKKDRRRACEP